MRFGLNLFWAAGAAVWWSGAAGAQNIDEMKLSNAAHYCYTEEAVALIKKGVDINSVNSGGFTPLMMAATYGCGEVARILLERGADIGVKNSSGWDAAYLAKLNNNGKVLAMIEAARGAGAQAAPALGRPEALEPARNAAPAPIPAGGTGARGWPKLGHYKPGQEVLYSGTAGKTWDRGVIKSIDPKYGYNIEGVTGSEDAFFVVAPEREPFWTNWFVGDWRVSVPMAMGAVTDGRYVYRTVSGGMRLPPLRINADGTYSWRLQEGKGERLVQGRWEPNSKGPGVVLKNAEKGADWLVYNNSRTGSTLGETVILSSDCCTYYDGSRLK